MSNESTSRHAGSEAMRRVKEQAGELISHELRSASVVLVRMRELIVAAHRSGHSHKAIHATLEAAGLRASWNTYRSCLQRMKKADLAMSSQMAEGPPAAPAAKHAAARDELVDLPYTSTHVIDALRQARELAASKDYGQIGRDLFRQQQQEQRARQRKERS